jgi:hypothetical protein
MKKPLFAIVCTVVMICTLSVLVALVGAVSTIYALAETDLEVVFAVTDKETGQPIEGAVVQVWWDDFDQPKRHERLLTDDAGIVVYKHGKCRCEDIITVFRRKTIYFLRGEYFVKAEGYEIVPKTWMGHTPYEVVRESSTKEGRSTRVHFSIRLAAINAQN